MSSFEWVELETLTSDIETARSRLADARKRNNQGAIAMLQTEIARAEKRRTQLLAHISTNVASAPEPASRPAARETAASRQAAEPVAAAVPEVADGPRTPAETDSAPEPAAPAKGKDKAIASEVSTPDAAIPEGEASEGEAPGDEASGDEASEGEASEGEVAEPPDRVVRIVAGDAASPDAAPNPDSAAGGTVMWDQLKPGDIARAKAELGQRRAEMLARHAEELKGLDADQGQLETLEQAIDAFLRKFNGASSESGVVKLDEERELRQQGSD